MNPLDPRPARRQSAETIQSLFALVKALDHKIELGGREMLDYARQAGQALARAKELCPPGEWMRMIANHWPGGGRSTAGRYMRIAKNWKKVKKATSIREALAWLVARAEETEKEPDSLLPQPELPTRDQDEPQVEDPQGEEESDPEPDGAAEERAKLAEIARGKALIDSAMRAFLRGRELLSEAYQTAAREVLDEAAINRASLLTLTRTDHLIRHGTTETGVDVGIPLMTNEALNLILQMAAGAKYMLEPIADEPDRAEPGDPGTGDRADDDAG